MTLGVSHRFASALQTLPLLRQSSSRSARPGSQMNKEPSEHRTSSSVHFSTSHDFVASSQIMPRSAQSTCSNLPLLHVNSVLPSHLSSSSVHIPLPPHRYRPSTRLHSASPHSLSILLPSASHKTSVLPEHVSTHEPNVVDVESASSQPNTENAVAVATNRTIISLYLFISHSHDCWE